MRLAGLYTCSGRAHNEHSNCNASAPPRSPPCGIRVAWHRRRRRAPRHARVGTDSAVGRPPRRRRPSRSAVGLSILDFVYPGGAVTSGSTRSSAPTAAATRVKFAARRRPSAPGASLVVSGHASRGALIVEQQQRGRARTAAASGDRCRSRARSSSSTPTISRAARAASSGRSRQDDGAAASSSTSRSRRPTCSRACASR